MTINGVVPSSPWKIEKIAPPEYPQLLKQLAADIRFHHTHAALKYFLEGRLKNVELSVYRIEGDSEKDDEQRERPLFFGLLHLLLGQSLKLLMNTNSRSADFCRSAAHLFLSTVHPILDEQESFYSAYIREDIREHVIEYFRLHPTHPFTPMDEPNIGFYSNEEQCNRLAKKEVPLADGYRFVQLAEEAAVQICAEQIYTSAADKKFVALRIRQLPAIGAVHEQSGDLACYEYADGLGVISLLYCQKAHRGQGLATAVEERVSQKHLKDCGIRPWKGVSINRPRVVAMSRRSYLWTEIRRPSSGAKAEDDGWDDGRELYYCTLRCKQDNHPRVVIYED